jgi:hypothetical protein
MSRATERWTATALRNASRFAYYVRHSVHPPLDAETLDVRVTIEDAPAPQPQPSRLDGLEPAFSSDRRPPLEIMDDIKQGLALRR